VAQVVGGLPSKPEVLRSNPSTKEKRKEGRTEGGMQGGRKKEDSHDSMFSYA
jgi:hypothetical protein